MGLVVAARGLGRDFRVRERGAGVLAGLFGRSGTTRTVTAVESLDLDIHRGEFVGLIGPNGAGKTTTIKLIAGLLYPTRGSLRVLDQQPFERRHHVLRRLAVIMGQHGQLWWELTAMDIFQLNRVVYGIPPDLYRQRLAELSDLLELGDLVGVPVRQLSLGQRARCELAAGLLHQPDLLLLDEPTLGLDVLAQDRVRSFLRAYHSSHGPAAILTSHNMGDIESLCTRLVVLHQGRVLYDGQPDGLAAVQAGLVRIRVSPGNGDEERLTGALVQLYPDVVWHKTAVGHIVAEANDGREQALLVDLRQRFPQMEVHVERPELEDVVLHLFRNLARHG